MLSLRLNPDLEKQLDFVSLTTGVAKNTIVQQALAKFLLQDELGRVPLASNLPELNAPEVAQKQFDRFNERLAVERDQVAQIMRWIAERQIWTKVSGDTSGNITPGIYGRNIVVGFNASYSEAETLVISKNLPAYTQFGATGNHYHITRFEDWVTHMRVVPIAHP